MSEEKTYYKREIIKMAFERGWTVDHITQFLNYYGSMTKGYTVEMLDTFEYSVNGPVFDDVHPSIGKLV